MNNKKTIKDLIKEAKKELKEDFGMLDYTWTNKCVDRVFRKLCKEIVKEIMVEDACLEGIDKGQVSRGWNECREQLQQNIKHFLNE